MPDNYTNVRNDGGVLFVGHDCGSRGIWHKFFAVCKDKIGSVHWRAG